jgi:hypothetical protein
LLTTLDNRERKWEEEEGRLRNQVQGLGDKVQEYQEIYENAPDGYDENTRYPQLRIPIGNGFYLPAKWIQRRDKDVACYSAQDGPTDSPHIIPIYAAPVHNNDDPPTPLPRWLRGVLTGNHAAFLTLTEAARKLDDWGVSADLIRYCETDEEVNHISMEIQRLEQDCASARHRLALIE